MWRTCAYSSTTISSSTRTLPISRHLAQVVAGQVDQHQVLGPLLLAQEQLGGQRAVRLRLRRARGRVPAMGRVRGHAVLHGQQALGRGGHHLQPGRPQVTGEGGRAHPPQRGHRARGRRTRRAGETVGRGWPGRCRRPRCAPGCAGRGRGVPRASGSTSAPGEAARRAPSPAGRDASRDPLPGRRPGDWARRRPWPAAGRPRSPGSDRRRGRRARGWGPAPGGAARSRRPAPRPRPPSSGQRPGGTSARRARRAPRGSAAAGRTPSRVATRAPSRSATSRARGCRARRQRRERGLAGAGALEEHAGPLGVPERLVGPAAGAAHDPELVQCRML